MEYDEPKVFLDENGEIRLFKAAELNRLMERYLLLDSRRKLRGLVDLFVDKSAMLPYLRLLVSLLRNPLFKQKISALSHDRDYHKFWLHYNPQQKFEFQDSVAALFSDIKDYLLWEIDERINDELWKEEQL